MVGEQHFGLLHIRGIQFGSGQFVHGPFHNRHLLGGEGAVALQRGQPRQHRFQFLPQHGAAGSDRCCGTDPGGGFTVGQLQHPHQELADSRAAILTGQVIALGVSDQAVINQRQLVAHGFEALPHRHLPGGCQVIKSTRFDGADQGIESFIEGVEGRIQWCALLALGVGGVPEFHASIVFETPFDDKLVCQEYKEKLTS